MDMVWIGTAVMLGWVAGGIAGGVAGIGGAMVSIPILSLFLPADEAILVSSITGTYATIHLAVAYRRWLSWAEVRELVAGAVPGFILGSLALKVAPLFLLQFLVCSLLLLFLGMQLFGSRIRCELPEHPLVGHAAGAVSGFVNGCVGMGGATLGVYVLLRGWSPDRARANMTFFFTIASSGGLFTQFCAGLFDADLVLLGLAGIAGCALGQVIGLRLGRHVDRRQFRRIILAFLGISAAVLLARAVSAIV